MTWDEAKLKVVFWQSGAWDIDEDHPPGIVSNQTQILTLLGEWYATSIGKAAIDKVIERYGFIRIGDSDEGGLTIHGTVDNDGYFLVDSDDTPHDHWLTPDGHWVESSLSISLLHEIMHLGWQYSDPPHWRGVANQATYEAAMNGAEYDYAGDTVRQVNAALVQRGLEEQQRSSYQALLLPDNDNNAAFQSGVSYTGGALVAISRIGFLGRNDNMDISARTDEANALMFGLDGADTLVGNRGNDFLYGGDDNDVLVGGAGDDQLWGGMLDEAGRADGTDTARYQSAPAGITINLNGGNGVPITVQDGQDGTDSLHSIEIVEGSTHADTLVLSDLTQAIANDLDYIDLGAGTDTIDVSALGGTVSFNPTNPANQTLTVGDAVLHLRNVERIEGNQNTLALDSSEGGRVDGAGGVIAWAGSSLLAYANFAAILGGEGDDRMFGGSEGHYLGGGGVNYLEGSGSAILESTTGDTFFSLTDGGTVISGSGNDFIQVSGSEPVTIRFGVGSGHDMLGSHFLTDPAAQVTWAVERQNDLIILEGLTPDDIELVWDYVQTDAHSGPEVILDRIGEAAIRIKSTGETLYLGTLCSRDYQYGYFYKYMIWEVAHFVDGIQVQYYARGPSFNNDTDGVPETLEMDIFSFDGVTRLSLFDLFDILGASPQELPPEAKAAADILQRMESAPLVGGMGSDSLVGTDGNDDMLGGAGADNLSGAAGDDYMRGDSGADVILADAGNDTVDGGTENDNLDGGDGADLLQGGDGDDTILGGLGNDNIVGGLGNDTLDGGSGDDLLEGGAGNDKITGNTGTDTVSYSSATAGVMADLSNTKAQNTVGAGTDTLATIENLTGSPFNDTLTGSSANNLINGATGNDTISGGGGNDILDGGSGNDILTGGSGTDTASYISASGGVSVNLAVSSAQNTVGAGTDTLATIENVTGSAFGDTLMGSSSANTIVGAAGDDSLNGGSGNDNLNGGLGNDILTGGAGDDIFIFDSPLGGSFDTITDFDANNNDKIYLDDAVFGGLTTGTLSASNFLVISNASGNATNANQKILYDQSTGDIYYDADGNGAGGKILFAHINLPVVGGTVDASDFSIV